MQKTLPISVPLLKNIFKLLAALDADIYYDPSFDKMEGEGWDYESPNTIALKKALKLQDVVYKQLIKELGARR